MNRRGAEFGTLLDALDELGDGAAVPAELLPRIAQARQRIAQALRQCDRLLREGLLAEAIGIAEDCGGLVRQAADLQARCDRRPALRAALAGIAPIDPMALERLNLAYVRWHAQQESWHALQVASLAMATGGGGPLERLAILDRLRRVDPRNPSIPQQIDALEAAALEHLCARVRSAADDLAALEPIAAEVQARGWAATLPTPLAQDLPARIARLRTADAKRRWNDLATRIHHAAAAMDRTALSALRPLWEALRRETGTAPPADAAALVEGAFRWIDELETEDARDLEAAQIAAALEQALDADAPLGEVEALEAGAARIDRTLPQRIALRIEGRRRVHDEDRRRLHRRRLMLATAALLLAIGLVGWLLLETSRRAEARSTAQRLDQLVDERRFDESGALLAELAKDPLPASRLFPGSAATLGAAMERAGTAVAADAARRDGRERALREIEALVDAQGSTDDLAGERSPSDWALEDALRRLGELDAGGAAERIAAARSRLEGALAARRAADATRLRSLLAAHERSAAALRGGDLAWDAGALATERAGVEALATAVRRDLQSAGGAEAERRSFEALLDRLAARLIAIDARSAAIALFATRLAELHDTTDETAFLEALRTLLSNHGDLLSSQGAFAAHERAADAAEAAVAIRAWREDTSRAIRVASPSSDPFHPADQHGARSIERSLAEHLQRHRSTPHADAATALRRHAERLSNLPDGAEHAAALLERRLRASGFVDLHRVPLRDGGFLYRRPGGGDAFERAILSEADLRTSAAQLTPWPNPTSPAIGPVEETMPARLLRIWLPRIAASEASETRAVLLDLVAEATAAEEADPLLQLAFLRTLWSGLRGVPGAEPDLAEGWLREVAAGRLGEAGVDWLRRAPEGRGGLASARRQARLAVAASPAAAEAAQRQRAWWRSLVAELSPLSPAGVLLPPAPGEAQRRLHARSIPAQSMWVLVPQSGGWMLAPLRLMDGTPVVEGPPPPAAPVQVFVR